MGYQVITDNGLMPRDGGKRLGFVAGGVVYAYPGVPLSLLALPAPPSRPRYADIPQCQSSTERCTKCRCSYTQLIRKAFAEGEKVVLQCEDCGTVMRRYYE